MKGLQVRPILKAVRGALAVEPAVFLQGLGIVGLFHDIARRFAGFIIQKLLGESGPGKQSGLPEAVHISDIFCQLPGIGAGDVNLCHQVVIGGNGEKFAFGTGVFFNAGTQVIHQGDRMTAGGIIHGGNAAVRAEGQAKRILPGIQLIVCFHVGKRFLIDVVP